MPELKKIQLGHQPMTALAKQSVLAAVRGGRRMSELLPHPAARCGREQTSVLHWDLNVSQCGRLPWFWREREVDDYLLPRKGGWGIPWPPEGV